jgi:hypothetical protein
MKLDSGVRCSSITCSGGKLEEQENQASETWAGLQGHGWWGRRDGGGRRGKTAKQGSRGGGVLSVVAYAVMMVMLLLK